jgi:hypothetical protein
VNRRLAVLVTLSMCVPALVVSPGTALAKPGVPPSDQEVIERQNRELDPQANDIDPQTGQSRFRPLPAPHHHGHDRTGTPTASDVMTTEMMAAAVTDPGQVGAWSYEAPFTGDQNMVHVVCSPTGKCLFVVGKGKKYSSYVYDPVTKTKGLVKTPDDLFCAGHVLLPDGRALVTGGTLGSSPWRGTKTQYAFDFVTETYQKLPDMAVGRWYPTVTAMADGRQLIAAGYDTAGVSTDVVEIFDPKTNVTSQLTPRRAFPLYPRLFQTSKPNEIFHAGPSNPGFWNPFTGAFKPVTRGTGSKGTGYASCFFGDVRDQNLMVMGGGWSATALTHVIDLDSLTPAFRAGPPLTAAKAYVSCVNLPDGTVFEANGGWDNKVAAASLTTGLLTSLDGPWQAMSPLPEGEHRLYHSVLYLQDDGRVVSVGSNPDGGVATQSWSHLVYSPPYLSKGTRPAITSHPTEVAYGGTYNIGTTVADGRTVTRVAVTSAPSATHSVDANQRYLSLPVTNGAITFPSQSTIMPPGWYRIWAVDSDNVPSVAKWVVIGGSPSNPSDTSAPSVPTGVTGSSPSSTSVTLSWTASNDNVGVTGYRVFRNGTQVGTPAGTSYTDSGLTAATTYSYTVAAVDAAGNASAQSSPATSVRTPAASEPPPPPPGGSGFVSAATATGTTTSTAVAAPAEATTGDVLLAVVSSRGTPTITAPPGWALVRMDASSSTMRQAVFVRAATTSNASTWTLSSAQAHVVQVVAYRGVDTTNPVVASGGALSTTTTITSPAVATVAGGPVLTFAGQARIATLAPASPLTERSEIASPSTVTYKVTADAADTTATGTTAGPFTTTANGSAGGIGQTVALRPRA